MLLMFTKISQALDRGYLFFKPVMLSFMGKDNILVINSGSSSIKYRLYRWQSEEEIARGAVERIAQEDSLFSHEGQDRIEDTMAIPNHRQAIKMIIEVLAHSGEGGLVGIRAVGHRVVHGGNVFDDAALVDESVRQQIDQLADMAPLHNPANLLGIDACRESLPGVPQVAVFDTAYHQTILPASYLYAIPYRYYQKYQVRRYGFHGISHRYVSLRVADLLQIPYDKIRLIICHLGNGASITAVSQGRSVDNSMGFTPLEGLMMGTRSGDLDPAIIPYIMKREGLEVRRVEEILNRESGLLGITGISSDLRDIEQAAVKNEPRAQLALEMFVYRIKKYIGAYLALLDGLDALVFTAGIGENSPLIREMVVQGLDHLGLQIDLKANQAGRKEKVISPAGKHPRVMVVPTNEELMIVRDTKRILSKVLP